jgi:hypothetical protein
MVVKKSDQKKTFPDEFFKDKNYLLKHGDRSIIVR